jgi:arsenite-transporting ATPase
MDFTRYRVIFLIGKGGVGKTTCSSAIAVGLANRGYRTLVVSLDPAHNLGDVLMVELGNKIKKVCENLWAIEVDIDEITKRYLKKLEDNLRGLYRYLTVINLDKYFEVLRYSPGVEEYAILEAIKDILAKQDEFDVIIFDTPPTGLMLRIFTLPKTTLLWLEKLIELRKKILDRRLTIEKVQGEMVFVMGDERIKLPAREEEDEVIKELKAYKEEIEGIHEIMTSESTAVIGVVNPCELSFLEMKRAMELLEKFGIPLRMVIVNKVEGKSEIIDKVRKTFKAEVVEVRKEDAEVRGFKALERLFANLA